MKIDDRIDKEYVIINYATGDYAEASDILALISQVECGECEKGKVTVSKFSPGPFSSDSASIDCPTCKGTGYRKVMVRRECRVCKGLSGECEYDPFTPFTPDDLLDIINKMATLELEVK